MSNNKEIDIIELFVIIFTYTKRYILVFIIAIILGAGVGFVKNKRAAKSFKSEMVIISKIQNDLSFKTMARTRKNIDIGNSDIIENIIKSFQKKLSNKNYDFLSQKTNLSKDELKNIISVSAKTVDDDNSADFDYITINVSARNREIFKNLSIGIVNYINNNSYLKQKNSKDSVLITELIKESESKISELSKYQKTINTKNTSKLIILNENSIFSESVNLMSYKQKLIQELNSLKTVSIIEEFYVPASATSSASRKNLILYATLFFVISIFLVLILILNKKAKEYQITNQN